MAGERCISKDCCEYRSEKTRLCMDDGWCTFQEWKDNEKPLNMSPSEILHKIRKCEIKTGIESKEEDGIITVKSVIKIKR